MHYAALLCPCGSGLFRLTGRARLAFEGRGGFFWRTLRRIWAEARQPMESGEPVESPFLLPLELQCDRCGRRALLFDELEIGGAMPSPGSTTPREAYRCRSCRRGRVALVVGVTTGSEEDFDVEVERGEVQAVELFARCHACRRQARVAWADARPSDQQARLDLLYGRR
ncbi:MAG: hypothetical protein JRG86_02090 [Deltaproteobacteria bacterium]|jgi:hypothetical protein|nr:hypothetical protein [Deltaproteobacteria bacterium]MBW2497085.1 hypothetical protein [Deltaproteobacteria bacterium]